MKIIEPKSVCGECIDIRRLDQSPEASDLGKPDIVEQEYDYVWCIFIRLLVLLPPLFGILVALGDNSAKAFNALLFYAVDHDDF